MKSGHPHYDLEGSLYALASQKHYMALYVTETDLIEAYRPRLGKLSIGKNRIRFRQLEDLPLDTLGALLREARDRRKALRSRPRR
jgi:hypothetical protein